MLLLIINTSQKVSHCRT